MRFRLYHHTIDHAHPLRILSIALDVVDDVEQVESDIMLTGYDGLQSHELRDNVDAIAPPSAQDVRQFVAETSIWTHQQQRSHHDFVYTLIKT